jgi:hypothetical protein
MNKPSPLPIRIVNTRTKSRTVATDGRDAARMLKIESDRRTGIELAAEDEQANREQIPAAVMLAAGAAKQTQCGAEHHDRKDHRVRPRMTIETPGGDVI